MARLDQTLLKKVAARLGKDPKYIREQVSRRASREGVASPVALVMWARDIGIGVATDMGRLPPHMQQQLAVPRVAPARAPKPQPKRKTPAARRTAASRRRKVGKWVFLSHSGEDKALARALIELFRAALDIPADKILCTSVDGFRLPAGAQTEETLREAVLEAKTLVGLITPTSQKSSYVLFELGARWGTGKHLIPLCARGVRPGELKGPIAGMNALNCSNRAEALQLIGDLGTALQMEVERPEVYDNALNKVVRASKKR